MFKITAVYVTGVYESREISFPPNMLDDCPGINFLISLLRNLIDPLSHCS